MPDSLPIQVRSAVPAALAGVWRAPVRVVRWERLGPWAVARAVLGDGRTVVVKWARTSGSSGRTEGWRVGREAAALRFLAARAAGIGPRVFAVDAENGFLVLEDLAPREALDRVLVRDGAAGHGERIGAFARVLGELGAATAGSGRAVGEPALAGLAAAGLAAAGLAVAEPVIAEPAVAKLAREAAEALGPAIGGPPAAEIAAIDGELAEPGPFLVFSNGDAEANNVLVHPAGPPDPRLIDFEAAGFRHALRDAVGLYVPGPRWLGVGDPVAGGVAAEYRRALARGIPEAEDDRRYGFGLGAACGAWALLRLRRIGTLDQRPAGDDSRRQLVATVEAAAWTAETYRVLPQTAGWFRRVGDALRKRWPDADEPLTDPARFPPYTARR